MAMKSRYHYRVELIRRVRRPEYGPEANYISSKTHNIMFGRRCSVKTGEEALALAKEYAEKHADEASEVAIWRCSLYKGEGFYTKTSTERFDTPWPNEEKETWHEQ